MTVGGEREASEVTISGNKTMAFPGYNSAQDGGNGYSGGGGVGYTNPCDGGTNGGNGTGDGDYSIGGNGTGEDISIYFFENYKLSSGEGGKHSTVSDSMFRGGGGGGVLINDEGPGLKGNKDGVEWAHGQGYGGGGTYHVDEPSDNLGAPGVIIIEVGKI